MTTADSSLSAFRRRLRTLIADRCDGKYTVLATRARIPVSSMEHIIHTARRLPGGEQLLRMAAALRVSLDYLATGVEAIRPADLLAHPVVINPGQGSSSRTGEAPQISMPTFRCGCPGPCSLTTPVPRVEAACSRLIIPTDLVASRNFHRLSGVHVDATLPCADWPAGTRLVIDWDAREPRWEALMLLHLEERCRLGHCTVAGERLLFAPSRQAEPVLVSGTTRILAQVVAAVAPCSLPWP